MPTSIETIDNRLRTGPKTAVNNHSHTECDRLLTKLTSFEETQSGTQDTNKNASQSSIKSNNVYFFSIVLKAQLNGVSSLPYRLGLSVRDYQFLLASLNDPEINIMDMHWQQSALSVQVERSEILDELIAIRNDERGDLIALLLKNCNKADILSDFAATIIATACLNPAHLWKSLAFNERVQLSQWIALNFPSLAAKNQNMRWKRFFYLQLCQQGGDYICRAPTCGECSSFKECFLPEPSSDS